MNDCVLAGHVGTSIVEDGRRLLFFGGNDYLGLASSDVLRAAARAALDGGLALGSGGSRLLRGNAPEHEELEAEAARFPRPCPWQHSFSDADCGAVDRFSCSGSEKPAHHHSRRRFFQIHSRSGKNLLVFWKKVLKFF